MAPPGAAAAIVESTLDPEATATIGTRVSSTPTPTSAGRRRPTDDRLGRYVIIDELGAGGMGVVYRAYDPQLDRRVALKVLKVVGDDAGQARDRLLREAQALAQLSHPNVVQVFDVGVTGDDVFVAMEYIDGCDLKEWSRSEDRSWRDSLRLYLLAGQGLAAAHDAGLVHRDFKPANVVVGDDGRVKVLDFGLARAAEFEPGSTATAATAPTPAAPDAPNASEPPATTASTPALADACTDASHPSLSTSSSERRLHSELTQAGQLVGTPAYMSPEQLTYSTPDARSDQFSFCVALYEALYEERPYRTRSIDEALESIRKGVVAPAPRGSVVPQWVRRCLLRGLAVKPDDRYPSMRELLAALNRDPAVRRRRIAAAVATIAIIAMAAVVVAPSNAQRDPCAAPERHLAGVWDSDGKAKLEAAFLNAGAPRADEAFAQVRITIDRFADEWKQQQVAACRAAFVNHTQSPSAYDLRMDCLGERLRPLRALLEVYQLPSAAMVRGAAQAMTSLPDLKRCTDLRALEARVAPPEDPTTAAAVDRVRQDIARSSALEIAGRHDDASTTIDKARDEAASIDYPPLAVEVLARRGGVLSGLGKFKEAKTALERAYVEASKLGHEQIATESAVRLIQLVGYQLASHDEGLVWSKVVLGAGDRLSADLRTKAHTDTGVVYWAKDELDTAAAEFEQGLAICEQDEHARRRHRASLLNNLGLALASLGDREGAIERYREALVEIEKQLGEKHPFRANALSNLGESLVALERADEALPLFDEAVEIWQRSYGERHSAVANGHFGRGQALLALEQRESAAAQFELALSIWTETLGAEHPFVVAALLGLAQASDADEGESIRRLRQALAICGRTTCDPRIHAEVTLELSHRLLPGKEGRALLADSRARINALPEPAAAELRSELDALEGKARP